ncbi:zinc ribbon domain-containing protein [Alicyclobacillus fastidiosus]|uniref:Zinc ribbon domain-containing protein n=1 Tax=Alicyclobacillus fastidiosus TaxID=392011 RepID=A0ABY6ZN45_9BACL|nr:hypothetical protein [Alicyclobacillus fastidiosus]WAH43867.1 zinc ribbon domain-containing protein [Alicyclobacillus fastidiosus]GMA60105.1 hypothetical protein GCM10025859_05450 [Alicyclobacillus fastidiosus]
MARCPKCGTGKFGIDEVQLEGDNRKIVVIVCAGCDTLLSIVHPQFNYYPQLDDILETLKGIEKKLK